MYYSPLRYPGGKRRLAKFIALICEKNRINGHYVEPYAGGAGVALHLLLNDYVSEITINDYDRSVYAFWHAVRNNSTRLCKAIAEVDVTMASWYRYRAIQKDKATSSLFDLGFSTFFLNRTNVSGALNGGVIGGMQQLGKYKIDCRFNKPDLIARIKKIAKQKSRIHLYNLDAIKLIDHIQENQSLEKMIFYFDPPYYLKGHLLYHSHYKHDDHKKVAEMVRGMKNARWIISYDDTNAIRDLYRNCKRREYQLLHTAHTSKIGYELIYFSRNLSVPRKVVL